MADTTAPAAPLLATIPRVEIASVGWWDISNATDWHPNAEDLANAVAALDCPAVRRPVLKFGHTGKGGEGDPAIGLVDNLAVADDGQTLVGDFVGVPAWFAEADAEGRSVIASSYPDRSGEFEHDYVCQLGHTHPFVVHAVALLGVKRPGIGTLQSLYDLFANAPEKEKLMPKAGVLSASMTVDQVRSAYYSGPAATNYNLWIREMFIDPPELIVQNDADDTLTRVSFSVSGDDVEFGDAQTVKVQYVNARAASEKPALTFATAAESRSTAPRTTQAPSAAGAEATGEEDTPVSDLLADLRKRFGLADDADEAAIQAALDKAVPEAAPDPEAEPDKPAETAPEQIAASAGDKHGVISIDAGQLAELQRLASLGAEAHERQQVSDREGLVAAAIKDGRIAPARKEHWLASLKADPGSAEVLASLQPGTIPLASIGHAGNPADEVASPENDPLFKEWMAI